MTQGFRREGGIVTQRAPSGAALREPDLDWGDPLPRATWERYCINRIVRGMRKWDAFREAGYDGDPHKGVQRLEKKPSVQARMADLNSRVIQRAHQSESYTREELLGYLLEVSRGGLAGDFQFDTKGRTIYMTDTDGEAILDEEGDAIPIRKPDRRSVIQAVELLGIEKDGMFPRNAKIQHSRADPFEGLSPEQILDGACQKASDELGWSLDLNDLKELILMARQHAARTGGPIE